MNSVSNKMNITRLFKASLAAVCLLAFGDVSARALVGLDYSVMTGNTVQVVFTFDEAAVAPRTFTIDQPARIALDFGETENKLEQRNMQVGIGAMQSIISAASKNRTRVVLNLTQKTNYTTSISGNQVTLTLAGGEQTVLPEPATGDSGALNCSENGVIAPLVGIIGACQALEAIKFLAGVGEPLIGSILYFDAKYMDWRKLTLNRRPQCPTCAAG